MMMNNYEFLSELCETVGNHRVGVGDLDECTIVIVADEERMSPCPICFESIEVGRKIKICSHTFCDECAEKWFAEHKTCPVCVRDITQILEISKSSSAGGASSSSMNTINSLPALEDSP